MKIPPHLIPDDFKVKVARLIGEADDFVREEAAIPRGRKVKPDTRGGWNRKWNRERIIKAFQEFYKEKGRSPTALELRLLDRLPSSSSLHYWRFRGIKAVCEAAGLPYQRST